MPKARQAALPVIALMLALTFVAAGCGGSKKSATLPNFQADDLAATPGDNWVTNGGSSWNQRYSSLDDVDTSNVSKLKGIWMTHLNGSGVAAKYSGESQPVVYNGVLYVTTGNDDVFAISVDTGKILWEHKSNIPQDISTVCCGWINRGVALGDGRVYAGQLDGKVVALDQKTGSPIWTRQLVQWQKGQTITGAPLYMNGKIYLGVVGADYGTRGFLEAIDAKTGKSVWRFYTIPAPDQPGGDTWPEGTNAYQQGGASIWSTPAYDKDLNLLYITTGNAGNDWFGGDREGDNLYAASIVALNADSGTVKWHFQEVHHDIWDYDTPSPAVLFDAGSTKGVGVPGKTGWLYLLDRATGKPLYGIDETPVPQDAEQKTAKTQPIPRNAAFIPHTPPSAKEIARVKGEITGTAKALPVVIAKTMFTPATTKNMLIYSPGPQGGNNWEPSSYNQDTQMFYVCAANQTVGVQAASLPYHVGKNFAGIGAIAGIGYNESPGTLTAIDATSGAVKWQKNFPDACYSGTVTTKGNLVFIGRSSGNFEAYDARNGNHLWSFQTGAAPIDTPVVFKRDGKEVIGILSAGNSLTFSPHGDRLWLFGLDGNMGPAAPPKGGQGTVHKGEGGGKKTQPTAGDATAGKIVFADNCAVCHGALGTGGNGGPDLTAIPSAKDATRVQQQVENGGGGMPAFKGQLSSKQIEDVTAYVTQKITNKQ